MSQSYADANHKHAVTSLSSGSTYAYDANGNMTTRTVGGETYTLTYDAENHLTSVSGAATATFVYDGDGARVKATVDGVTTAYIGNHFEWHGYQSNRVFYYYAGGSRIAMKEGSVVYFLLSDHLGSTTVSTTGVGDYLSELRYKPWGETRYSDGTTPTRRHFTGQIEESSLGLYWYGSRWYDPGLGRFTQPDSMIPDVYNPFSWDHYSYVFNNPIKFTDPSGHCAWDLCLTEGTALIVVGSLVAIGALVVYATNPDAREAIAEGFEWAAEEIDHGLERLRTFAKTTPPKPMTQDEQEKVDHLLEDLDDFIDKHPDLAEEAARQVSGEEGEYDHVTEAEEFMRGVEKDIAHLQSVYRSRNEEAQASINHAIEQAQAWLERMQEILRGTNDQ